MTDLAAAADVLGRAADRLEQRATNANGGEPPDSDSRWGADGHTVRWLDGGGDPSPAANPPVAENCTPAEAEFIATVDPRAVAALVPALRVAAKWAGYPAAPFSWTADLLEFARRVLREEETP